jgi:hypothetical protein
LTIVDNLFVNLEADFKLLKNIKEQNKVVMNNFNKMKIIIIYPFYHEISHFKSPIIQIMAVHFLERFSILPLI